MKLDDYIRALIHIKAEHGNIDLIYSVDEEGNWFNIIHNPPCAGLYEDGEFTPSDDPDVKKVNCVCVN